MSILHDHGFVHAQAAKLSDALHALAAHGDHETAHWTFAPEELRLVANLLRQGRVHEEDPGTGAYFARDPLISLVQSAMYEHLETTGRSPSELAAAPGTGDPVTRENELEWGLGIVTSLIGTFLHGKHPFLDAPARLDTGPRARLVLVSDWGTGQAEAKRVIEAAAPYLRDTDDPVHLIHLGDTYYSGTPLEAEHHVLRLWPVDGPPTERIRSWALNGNHDMYSGGHGYFQTTLGDERFASQRVDGKATSWFHITCGGWDIVGLDSAYRDPLVDLRHGTLFWFGALGYLDGQQARYVNDLSADPRRRRLLLSHHQLFSAYDLSGTRDNAMRTQLAPTLEAGIDAWLWGHEHDCVAYEPWNGVTAARAIGHGAVPAQVRTTPGPDPTHLEPPRVVTPIVAPGTPADDALRAVRWEYRDWSPAADGTPWAKHGFAVVDVSPEGLRARHVDEDGTVYVDETL